MENLETVRFVLQDISYQIFHKSISIDWLYIRGITASIKCIKRKTNSIILHMIKQAISPKYFILYSFCHHKYVVEISPLKCKTPCDISNTDLNSSKMRFWVEFIVMCSLIPFRCLTCSISKRITKKDFKLNTLISHNIPITFKECLRGYFDGET